MVIPVPEDFEFLRFSLYWKTLSFTVLPVPEVQETLSLSEKSLYRDFPGTGDHGYF